MKTLVVRNICDEVSTQKSFSIINDGTQGILKKDAQAVLLRYVTMQDGVVRPVERLETVVEKVCVTKLFRFSLS